MTKFYRKDIPQMPVYVHGVPLKFELLETADAALIEELDKCITFGRGGVMSITKEEFEDEAKKKPTGTLSESGYKQRQQRVELSSPLLNQNLVAEGGINIGGQFARPQDIGRAHEPREKFGLPNGAVGPGGGRPMPDPIEVPRTADMKPPTAKLSELNGV
jgi:hypothetical protein